jgi:uncharacterized protein YbcV (DUF1398 family)
MKLTNPAAIAVIEQCAQSSKDGTAHFGQIVAALMAEGVESYQVDYRLEASTYYLPDGSTHQVALAGPDVAIAQAFDAAGVQQAIRGAQSGQVMYPEFLRLTRAAGCVGYTVWLAGRHVVYYGRRGETHVERFPD